LEEILACRTNVQNSLWNGDVAIRCLRPAGFFEQYTAEALGQWLVGLAVFTVPLLLASPLLGVSVQPASGAALAWFVASLLLAVSVGLAIEYTFAALMILFFYRDAWAINRLRYAVSMLLSGGVIPLVLLPWGIGDVLALLPFASVASAPLLIYTGMGDPPRLVLLQLFWSGLLWPVAFGLWRSSQERIMSHGG
jgi:ABC-2 type transport system permease protein